MKRWDTSDVRLMISGFIFGFSLLLLLVTSCAEHRQQQRARLAVPPECVDKITLIEPVPIGEDGSLGKGKFKIAYHCTKVIQQAAK